MRAPFAWMNDSPLFTVAQRERAASPLLRAFGDEVEQFTREAEQAEAARQPTATAELRDRSPDHRETHHLWLALARLHVLGIRLVMEESAILVMAELLCLAEGDVARSVARTRLGGIGTRLLPFLPSTDRELLCTLAPNLVTSTHTGGP